MGMVVIVEMEVQAEMVMVQAQMVMQTMSVEVRVTHLLSSCRIFDGFYLVKTTFRLSYRRLSECRSTLSWWGDHLLLLLGHQAALPTLLLPLLVYSSWGSL